MSEWEEYKLLDVADVIAGYAFKSSEFGRVGESVVKIKDINPPYVDILNTDKVDIGVYPTQKMDKYKICFGDYVIAMTGATIGKIGRMWHEGVAYINQRVAKIKAKQGIDNDFVYYAICGDSFQQFIRNNIDSNSAQENISTTSIGKFPITLPSLAEQKRIAAILGALDDKIELNRCINANLEQQAQTLFKQWFIQNNDDCNLGKLGDIIEIFDSQRKPLSGNERDKMRKLYPYYGAAALMDYVDDYLFDGIYLLLGEDGTVVTNEGFPVLQYVEGKFWVNNHAHILQGKNGFSVEVLYILLSQTNIQLIITGAVQPKISQYNLRNLQIPVLPIDKVKSYDNMI